MAFTRTSRSVSGTELSPVFMGSELRDVLPLLLKARVHLE